MRWENFRIGNVLNFDSSNGIFHAINVTIENTQIKGSHPYVVRTSQNNGIRGYIIEDENKLNPANTISFAQDTAEMFYQAESYFTGNKVKVLSLKKGALSKEIALFLITCLKKAFSNFVWGSSYDTKILIEVPLSLPIKINEDGNPIIDATRSYHKKGYIPDFDCMQNRIAELEQNRIAELEQYLLATGLNDYELTNEDKEILTAGKEVRNFKVSDLFVVEGTKSLDAGKLNFKDNGINYIGRTDDNNGVQGKIEKQSFEPNATNTLTITVIGNYKYVKYQEEPYYCSQNINKLTPKFKINNSLGLWFRSEIQKFASLYNGRQGGYKLNELKEFEVPVPIQIDATNSTVFDVECRYHPNGYIPDWEFIEKYIKAIEKIVIKDVVDFKDKQLRLLKKII